jgi:hypothetical protein
MTVAARFTTMLVVAVLGALASTTVQAPPRPTAPTTGSSAAAEPVASRSTAHFIANVDGARAARRAGFTVFDTGASRREVNALPRGVRALVWLGQKCPSAATRGFKASVRRLAANRKVFGYYLSDEPHIGDCPGGPAALRSRAKFIAAASQGRQRSFVVLSEKADYRAFRPAVTRVSLVGLNPYPCSVAHPSCDFTKVRSKVRAAVNAGVPRTRIVPVYQAFGQSGTGDDYYLLPSPSQMRTLLRTWARFVPHPVMDYTYGWANQRSARPTLVDSPALQTVFRTWFAR